MLLYFTITFSRIIINHISIITYLPLTTTITTITTSGANYYRQFLSFVHTRSKAALQKSHHSSSTFGPQLSSVSLLSLQFLYRSILSLE